MYYISCALNSSKMCEYFIFSASFIATEFISFIVSELIRVGTCFFWFPLLLRAERSICCLRFAKSWNTDWLPMCFLLFALCLLSFVCLEACIYYMHCPCLERGKIDFVMVCFVAYNWESNGLFMFL